MAKGPQVTARVIPVDFRAHRAKRIALRKAVKVRWLIEMLEPHDADGRAMISEWYVERGWADAGEVREAFRALGEMER